eukprot:4519543-Pleurochrysis_carterae.AAC.1
MSGWVRGREQERRHAKNKSGAQGLRHAHGDNSAECCSARAQLCGKELRCKRSEAQRAGGVYVKNLWNRRFAVR